MFHRCFVLPLADLDIVHSFLSDNALILCEFASGSASRENLIDLFQRAPFHFGHEKEKEADAEDVRSRPDVAILGALHICQYQHISISKRMLFTQFRLVGLIKYGAVKLVSHARIYPKLVADPTVQARSLELTNSVATG